MCIRDRCVRVSVVSVIVKRPVLPPCVVDERSRNLLYYYYYYEGGLLVCLNPHQWQASCIQAWYRNINLGYGRYVWKGRKCAPTETKKIVYWAGQYSIPLHVLGTLSAKTKHKETLTVQTLLDHDNNWLLQNIKHKPGACFKLHRRWKDTSPDTDLVPGHRFHQTGQCHAHSITSHSKAKLGCFELKDPPCFIHW